MGRFLVAEGHRLSALLIVLAASTFVPSRATLADRSWPMDGSARSGVPADFDGDGAHDLAVGVPLEGVGTLREAGAVTVLHGSHGTGLSGGGSQLLTQDSAGVGRTAAAGDHFGAALAVGDFDADGFGDLAIGAPDARAATLRSAGVVTVLYGLAVGLTTMGGRSFTQGTIGVDRGVGFFERFGAALAAGDLDGDGVDELAIGTPAAPVQRVEGAGVVNVLYGSAAGLLGGRVTQVFDQGVPGVVSDPETGDGFGAALAIGDVNGDGPADLAVGVPGEAVGTVAFAGAINVLFGTPGGLTGSGSQLFHQGVRGIGSDPERDDGFRGSIAVCDFDGNGADDLALGVGNETVGTIRAGAVNVVYGAAEGLNSGRASQLFTQNTTGLVSDAETDDGFGHAVAAGNFDDDAADDLAIGAPGRASAQFALQARSTSCMASIEDSSTQVAPASC